MEENIIQYIELLVNDGRIRGRNAITQLIAIGIAESGLDNLAIGNNAKNGTPPDSPAYYDLGIGWLQHDTYWLRRDTEVNGVEWSFGSVRSDPLDSIRLLFDRPGFVVAQTPDRTYLNYKPWATWPLAADNYIDQVEAIYDQLMSA